MYDLDDYRMGTINSLKSEAIARDPILQANIDILEEPIWKLARGHPLHACSARMFGKRYDEPRFYNPNGYGPWHKGCDPDNKRYRQELLVIGMPRDNISKIMVTKDAHDARRKIRSSGPFPCSYDFHFPNLYGCHPQWVAREVRRLLKDRYVKGKRPWFDIPAIDLKNFIMETSKAQ